MGSKSRLVCELVSPSAAVELAWLLDLLVQDANYAEPALDELDHSLLPGVATLRPAVKRRYASLWADALSGCPELVMTAAAGGCLFELDPRGLFDSLSTLPKEGVHEHQLMSEARAHRKAIRRRLEALDSDVSLRRAYRNILVQVWDQAAGAWGRKGRTVARRSAVEWAARLGAEMPATRLIQLLPPRHPLTSTNRASATALLRVRRRFTVVPAYFCMSGGLVVDLDDSVLVAVPASAEEPIRHSRDAAFVASRLQVLAETTRVRIFIHLLTEASGVMEISRALGISQPSVSAHVHQLLAAGLIRSQRAKNRHVYVTTSNSVDRLLEDARATLARWVPVRRSRNAKGALRPGPRR